MSYNNINGIQLTKNCEKCILVCYVDSSNLSKERTCQLLNNVKSTIEKDFNNTETDDTMVFIYLPSNHFDIKVLTPANSFLTEEDINKYKEAFNNFIENDKK